MKNPSSDLKMSITKLTDKTNIFNFTLFALPGIEFFARNASAKKATLARTDEY